VLGIYFSRRNETPFKNWPPVFDFTTATSKLIFWLQAGTGDDFLDDLLSNDTSLDDSAVPDGIDSSINMTGHEVTTRSQSHDFGIYNYNARAFYLICRKCFRFQNALGYSWRCKVLQRWCSS
jgi:hypothetical protein